MATLSMDFGNGNIPKNDFNNYERIIEDRGSVYSVSVGRVTNREQIKDFLKQTKGLKRHNKATHHSWAARIAHDGAIFETKRDDGETGAGAVILRIIQKMNYIDTAICVVRWYGGIQLHATRFKHIQDAAMYGLH
ncbi:MAG: putative IMPACT (imprinted ancient) family translation regulator, partial [Planctomycetota bacterium]